MDEEIVRAADEQRPNLYGHGHRPVPAGHPVRRLQSSDRGDGRAILVVRNTRASRQSHGGGDDDGRPRNPVGHDTGTTARGQVVDPRVTATARTVRSSLVTGRPRRWWLRWLTGPWYF